MGVKDLWEVLAPVARKVQLDDLRGKRLAVDLSGWIVESEQMRTKIRQPVISKNVGTLIEADQICADGYDVDNLISADRRRCGFMAEYFIKPPVTVLLTLPCPTELSCVVVGLIRGPVKLTGFEIWVSHTGVGATSSPQDDFVLVGKKYEATGDLVQLRNRCYVPRGPFASLMREGRTPSFAYDSHGAGETLKTAHCKYVYRIKLKLTRAMGSASIGLGSLQVWGQPMAALCSLAAQEELIRQFLGSATTAPNREHSTAEQRRLHQPSSSASTVPEQVKSVPAKSKGEQEGEVTKGELQIPTDFLDALTFELMTQPVVLPSGQIVDQSTLDKHVDTEEKWGRPPTDPFTGITLTGINCPKSLPELKSRIDHFVVRNLEKLGNIPRTLGGNPAGTVNSARPSGLISLSQSERPSSRHALNETTARASTKDATCSSQNCRRPSHLNAFSSQGTKPGTTGLAGKFGAVTSSTSNLVTAHSRFNNVDQRALQAPRMRRGAIPKMPVSPTSLPRAMPVPQSTKQHAAFMSDASSSSNKQKLREGEKRKLESTVNASEGKQPRYDLKTHEERLADSLSSSLAETLQRIRNSTQGKTKVPETDSDLCSVCKASQSTHRVPCGHHFCRACLMNTVKNGQCTCGKLFQSSEVVRVHCSEQKE